VSGFKGPLDFATQALEALHVGDDLKRLKLRAARVLLPPRVRVPEGPPGPPSPGLEVLLRARERRLDVGLGATLIACEDQPELDPELTVDQIQEWSDQARVHLNRTASALARLTAFNDFFFETLGIEAAPTRGASRYDEDRLADLLLPHVVRRRRGHCVGLSTLYLALGYRLGLPLYGVSVPGHFFVRWEGEGLRRNIELTSRGAVHDDAYYVERFRIGKTQVDRGVYLQSLRRREVLVEVLNNRANFYWDRGDEARVLRDLNRVVSLSGNYAQAYVGRGFVNLQRGDLRAAEGDLRQAIEIDAESGRAWLLLGQVLLRRGSSEAEEALTKATELDPQSALAASYRGLLHQQRGQPGLAKTWQENALQLDPRCHMAWIHQGQAALATSERLLARRCFLEAQELQPDSLRAREGLVITQLDAEGNLPWAARQAMKSVFREYERKLRAAPESDSVRASYLHFLGEVGQNVERAEALAAELIRRNGTVCNVELAAIALGRLDRIDRAIGLVSRALARERDEGGNQVARLEAVDERLRRAHRSDSPRDLL
jgi:regulator of sirC expression with transglutaminase-like and TPR domain